MQVHDNDAHWASCMRRHKISTSSPYFRSSLWPSHPVTTAAAATEPSEHETRACHIFLRACWVAREDDIFRSFLLAPFEQRI